MIIEDDNIRNLDQLLESYLVTDYKSLKNYQSLTESDKKIFSKNIVTKLFNTIKNKALNVDYYGIENSKGDLKKCRNYNDIDNAIHVLMNIYNSEKSPEFSMIPKLKQCQDILIKYKNDFMKGFSQNNEIVIMTYTNISAALIGATGRFISVAIKYIKDPSVNVKTSFKKAKLDKNVYFKSIDRFIRMEKKGQLNQILKLKNLNESFGIGVTENEDVLDEGFGTILAIGTASIMIIIILLNTIRGIVFAFYFGRTKLSDYLLLVSYFLEENANNINDNNTKKKSTKKRQLELSAKLKRLSEKIAVDDEKTDKKVEEESKKDDDKNKESDNGNNSSSSGNDNSDDEDILL